MIDPSVVHDVAIVGSGASGVLAAIHLLRRCPPSWRIALIGDAPAIGEGIAYSTRRAEHLLNVTAGRMSAFEDDPQHFVRHLCATQAAGADAASVRDTFAQRRHFAAYLRSTLDEASTPRAGAALTRVVGEATAIDDVDDLRVVACADGASLRARAVVLALGNWPRRAARATDADTAIATVSGWDFDGVARIGVDETVAIAGSGLSMVDAVLTLASNAHRGAIHVASRHGLMPLPHAPHGHAELDVEALAALPLRARIAALRASAATLVRDGKPWQWVMDSVRPHNVRLWQTLPSSAQRQFLRHVSRYWDVHRHRIPPVAAATIAALRGSRQLTVHRGRLRVAGADRERRLRIGSGASATRLQVDRVIDCTGMQLAIADVPSRLVRAMTAQGRIRAGRHGIGFETDEEGCIIGAGGCADARVRALGSARIGQRWESIAVPELRQQAAAIAAGLIAALGERGA